MPLNSDTSKKADGGLVSEKSIFIKFLSALMSSNFDLAKNLMASGVSVDVLDEQCRSPLMLAAFSNSCSSVQFLLEHGADVNAFDKNGQTPLIYSAFNGSKDAASMLLSCEGINIEAKDITDSTALYRASASGSVDVVKLLIEHGADKNAVNCFGETPLVRSIINGNLDIAFVLIDSGADVNLSDGKVRTPLFAAATHDRVNIAQKLLSAGADPCKADSQGDTALIAAAEKDSVSVIKMFLKLNLYSSNEIEKAVIRASLKNCRKTVSVLLKHSRKNQKRNTFAALICACLKDCQDIIQECMNFGCDINDSLYFNMTPLMIACYSGAENAATQLVICGADVNKSDSDGVTALMYAASKGNSSIVMLLIRNGADKAAADKEGKTFDDYCKTFDSRTFSEMVMDRANVIIEKRDGEHYDQIPVEQKSFIESFSWYRQKYFERFPDMQNVDIYRDAGLTKQTFSKIISKRKSDYRPKKETVISLAVGMKLSKNEAEDFLRSAGYVLSKSDNTDLLIKRLLSSENYDIFDWNNRIYESTGKIFFKSIIADE